MKALIIQGGGFRTAFSAGVLDAFLEQDFDPFDMYIGVSGGANAVSYFMAHQHGKCLESIYHLAEDTKPKIGRLIKSRTLLNLEFFNQIANELVPFDTDFILNHQAHKKIGIVMTNRQTGKANYVHPTIQNWVDCCIASCALPFVSKGKHPLFESEFMDGSWSDPLPVKWAIEQGATEIYVVRTAPKDLKEKPNVLDRLASIYFRKNPSLKTIFANNHLNYNNAIDYINENPKGAKIHQVAPERVLLTNNLKGMQQTITEDYAYGLAKGQEFLKFHLEFSSIEE